MNLIEQLHCNIIALLLLYLSVISVESSYRRIMPQTLNVRNNEDMQLRLTEILNEETSCYVRTPTGMTCNLKVINVVEQSESCDKRINYWTENGECGVYVENVQMSDTGMWRIISTNSTNHKLLDAAYVNVLDEFEVPKKHVTVWSGLNYTLMFEDAEKFCTIGFPYNRFNNNVATIRRDCNVELSPVSTIHDGNWSAIVAVAGQIEEVVETTNVTVFPKRLHSGYKWSKNSTLLQLYCNLIADDNQINMCRFFKETNKTGFRLTDGLRKGTYGYYGAGFAEGQCGLAIYRPNESDYGQWYCSVASKDEFVFTASIWVSVDSGLPEMPHSAVKAWSIPLITSVTRALDLTCFANVPLTYCWFSLPNGETLRPSITSSDGEDPSENYSTNVQLLNGICSAKITEADMKHNGVWTCHMGTVSSGMEVSTNLTVRITGTPLAAKMPNIFVKVGANANIECRTVPSAAPLKYCRFFSPSGLGININEITKNTAIKRNGVKYYFNGTNLRLGECALFIENVKSEHSGEWTCATTLEKGETHEFSDTVFLFVNAEGSEESNTEEGITAIAAVGIGAAVTITLIIIVVAVLIVTKKFRSSIGIPYLSQRSNNRRRTDTSEISCRWQVPIATRRNTSGSNDSSTSQ